MEYYLICLFSCNTGMSMISGFFSNQLLEVVGGSRIDGSLTRTVQTQDQVAYN